MLKCWEVVIEKIQLTCHSLILIIPKQFTIPHMSVTGLGISKVELIYVS